jgi:hypothetical protein
MLWLFRPLWAIFCARPGAYAKNPKNFQKIVAFSGREW